MLNHPFRKILTAAVLLSFGLLAYAEEVKQVRKYTQEEIVQLALVARDYEMLPYSCAPGKACEPLEKRIEKRVDSFMKSDYTSIQAKKAQVDRLSLVVLYRGFCQALSECIEEGFKQ